MKKSIYALLIILLSSCIQNYADNNKTPTEVTFQEAGTWFTEEFNTDECQIPCFLNITPGETSMDQALMILKNRTDIQGDPNIYYANDQTKNILDIQWNFADGSYIQLSNLNKGNIVKIIRVNPSEQVDIKLGTLFDNIGVPDDIYFFSTEKVTLKDVTLVNHSNQVAVSFLLKMENEVLNIDENIQVFNIYLGTNYENAFSEFINYEFSQKWIGFGEYKDIP